MSGPKGNLSKKQRFKLNRVLSGISDWGESHLPGMIFWAVLMPPMLAIWWLCTVVAWIVLPPTTFSAWKERRYD